MPLFQINRPPPLTPAEAMARRAAVIRWSLLVGILFVGGAVTLLFDGRGGYAALLIAVIVSSVVQELLLWRWRRRARDGQE
ncbi:MAG TPA: hypothetical protein VLK58_17290 [Conexibacter sp.]|nr:hypothetical protein [Conexibacter sp.]